MDLPVAPRLPTDGESRLPGGWWPHSGDALPAGIRDRTGQVLALGDVVHIGGGEHAGQVAEVVGWGGRRGVELVVPGLPPAFVAVSPEMLQRDDKVRLVERVLPGMAGRRRSLADHGPVVAEPT